MRSASHDGQNSSIVTPSDPQRRTIGVQEPWRLEQLRPVWAFKSGTAPYIYNVKLGRDRRSRTNDWGYAGANRLKTDRLEQLAIHPTP